MLIEIWECNQHIHGFYVKVSTVSKLYSLHSFFFGIPKKGYLNATQKRVGTNPILIFVEFWKGFTKCQSLGILRAAEIQTITYRTQKDTLAKKIYTSQKYEFAD